MLNTVLFITIAGFVVLIGLVTAIIDIVKFIKMEKRFKRKWGRKVSTYDRRY